MGSRKWKAFQAEHDRAKDLEFLEKLRVASEEELLVLERNYSHKGSPAWKKIAIARALQRCRASHE